MEDRSIDKGTKDNVNLYIAKLVKDITEGYTTFDEATEDIWNLCNDYPEVY